jgi:hypothetical protein
VALNLALGWDIGYPGFHDLCPAVKYFSTSNRQAGHKAIPIWIKRYHVTFFLGILTPWNRILLEKLIVAQ